MSKKKGDYKVGYGRPPVEHQVKKGQILNPKGRPRGTRNFATDIREEAGKIVEIQENGALIKVSKQRLLIKSLFNRSLTGSVRDKVQVLTLMMKLGDQGGEDAPEEDGLQADELELLDLLQQRALRRKGGTA